YAAARLNLAHIYLAASDRAAAEAELDAVIALLEAEAVAADQLLGPYFPREFGAHDVALEDAWTAHVPGSAEWTEQMRRILLWRAREQKSRLAYDQNRFAEAADHARAAVTLAPHIGATRHRLAVALRALGRWQEATAEYRRTWTDAPLT